MVHADPARADEMSLWTAEHVAAIAAAPLPATPIIAPREVARPIAGLDLWDFWPVQELDGRVARLAGGELWMALSAPATGDPVLRHDRARIRLLGLDAGGEWSDLGHALPDGLGPGSREWSGSAIVDAAHSRLTLFFTAAGRAGERAPTYEQRLFQTRARLSVEGGAVRLDDWSAPRELVASDGARYHPADQATGAAGTIKAFRDPGFFRDPADGGAYLFFTASLGRSASAFNGAVGVARADDESLDNWTLLPPMLGADGLNNELERPHVIFRAGRYHLFWSTQRAVFAPGGPSGPTGLYGMVASHPLGPWEPLNSTGLVLCNPPAAPSQAYSWLVLDDLSVVSFVDLPGCGANATMARESFGGAPAPWLNLTIQGRKTQAPRQGKRLRSVRHGDRLRERTT